MDIGRSGVNLGCGDFQLITKDKSIICGRSMEFPISMSSQVTIYPKGEDYVSTAPNGKKGLAWTSIYGFTGISGLHLKGIVEGMNEKISFGVLTLLCSEYQSVSVEQEEIALSLMDVGAWILGSFATVAEVKEAIKNVRIWGGHEKVLGTIPGLHIVLHDSLGNNGVIEFIGGEVFFYDNPNGVTTNDPPLPLQLKNLEKYKNLTPFSSDQDLGSGMKDIPGSGSSKSRFVRISKDVEYGLKAETALDGIIEAEHILNSVDILKGMMAFKTDNEICYESTLWCTIKDLTNKIFIWRSYNDSTFRKIDLKRTDFNKKSYEKIDVQAKAPTFIDMTDQF